jgi:hypothetical protein
MTLHDVVTLGQSPRVEGGLVSLALPLPPGWQRGVTGIGTDACLTAGTHLFCPGSPGSPGEKEFQSLDAFDFDPFVVEVSVVCSNLGITDEAESAARSAAAVKAEAVLGAELATGAYTGNPSFADAVDFGAWADAVEALSGLEGVIASNAGGFEAWVHVAPSDLVLLVAGEALWRDLNGWRTPGGHVVISSPGYQAFQEGILVATPPVHAEVGEVSGIVAQDRRLNRRMATFEASVIAAFDPCGVVQVRFPQTSPTSP